MTFPVIFQMIEKQKCDTLQLLHYFKEKSDIWKPFQQTVTPSGFNFSPTIFTLMLLKP